MPVRVTGPSVLNLIAPRTLSRANTTNPHESSKPLPARVCLCIYLFPETTGLGNGTPTSPLLHSALVLKNLSLAARIAAGCSLPFTDPMLSAAALNCTRQLYKGSTPRTEQQELSLSFSHHLYT